MFIESRKKSGLLVTGTMTEEFDCVAIDVERMERVAMVEDARCREVA